MTEPYVRPGDHRRRDELGRVMPRNIFRDPVTLFRAFPGLNRCFEVRVPDDHAPPVSVREGRVSGHVVDCVCGARIDLLVLAELRECPGSCGRWFVSTGRSVRVARFPKEEAT